MGNTWLCIPSARPSEEAEKVLKLWKDRGYKVAIMTDDSQKRKYVDLQIISVEYPGYSQAVNELRAHIIGGPLLVWHTHVATGKKHRGASFYDVPFDPECEWLVTGGDDTEPDPNHSAEEIAAQCSAYFLENHGWRQKFGSAAATFGVMQCTGDRWHEGVGGFTNAPIDRVCGSPWMGREFCRRIYGGNGPLWPEFQHMYEDEHLQCVAQKLGILWQRRDLIHKHNHWGRGATEGAIVSDPIIPTHLEKWNTSKHWQESKAIFERLKAGGFAEAENLLP